MIERGAKPLFDAPSGGGGIDSPYIRIGGSGAYTIGISLRCREGGRVGIDGKVLFKHWATVLELFREILENIYKYPC